ncbi:DUF4225 domain-containing protein [Rahnella sp. PD12R]|uniref:DUF4225 domain-containing protein n=1 Tax=Rahnella sp. PD12R TaxID=2855688 RepID=UPI001C46EC93|nr:DUF4225 domain-containing protein [Rahnella sp. PD12R]MBV6818420.1 DUF4225 domain-containing protein [Rahnella sp. PD12R]
MYLKKQGNEKLLLKTKELIQLARTLSYDYLANYRSRQDFNKSIYEYSEKILKAVSDNCLTVDGGNRIIQSEIDSLLLQSRKIQTGRIEQYAAVRLEIKKDKEKERVNVILAQVGFVGGGTQIYTGAEVCLASLGFRCASWGIPLISHGTNNMWENGYYLLFRKNSPGWIREGYRKIAVSLGEKQDVGDYAYAVVDLSLSVYGVSRKIYKPREHSWKLWDTMNNDYILGWREMGTLPLIFEVAVDGSTAYTGYSQFKTIKVGNSFDNQ